MKSEKKTKTRKPIITMRQRNALDNLVENGGNVSKAMIDAKYTPATAKTPQKLTESKGFQLLCEQRGLTDKFLVDALVEDIEKKEQNRKPELELGFKILGRLNEKQEGNKTLIVNISGETAQRYGITSNTETSGE